MPEAFDPYCSWLGIPPAEQPADYYRLLGISRFESSTEVIANAADRQIRHIESFKSGAQAKEAQSLLKKLEVARACLLDVEKKCIYDRAIRGTFAAENSPPIAVDPPQAHSQKVATGHSRPRTRNPLVELAKILLGGIAGLVIGNAILWYGFGMDVFGVMESPAGRATPLQPLAQSEADVQPKPSPQVQNHLDQASETKLAEPDIRPVQVPEPTITQSKEAVPTVPVEETTAESDDARAIPSPQESLTEDDTPPIAVAPFDAEQAHRHQQTWADYLGIPTEFTNSVGMKFRLLPPGEFQMGDHRPDQPPPAHQVQLAKPCYVSVFEVTQSEYQEVMETNPSAYSKIGPQKDVVKNSDTTRFPVENVSWLDANRFSEKLSTKAGERQLNRLYRLATEAEWEYACRAGTTSMFAFGDSLSNKQANVGQGSPSLQQPLLGPRPVGSFSPNGFGLFDMHGNVWEWCADWLGPYPKDKSVDPVGPVIGEERILRGSGFVLDAMAARSANRNAEPPEYHSGNLGFRVVCLVDMSDPPKISANPTSTAQEDEQTKASRIEIPDSDAIANAELAVRSIFADDYARTKQPVEKIEFAERLLQIGLDTNDDMASRFVTIRSARNVAAEGGNVDLAFRALDALTDSFELNTLAEQARLIEELAKAKLNDDETAMLKHRLVELRGQAFDGDDFMVAGNLNDLARGIGKATDKQWREATDLWSKRLEDASVEFKLVQQALQTLESSPDDAAANLTIDRYRLLTGEWQKWGCRIW